MLALGQLISWGTLFYAITFLAAPISRDEGWSREHLFGAFSLALLVAGLRGGGWQGTAADLARAEIAGGITGAARLAAELLARAFAPPPERPRDRPRDPA